MVKVAVIGAGFMGGMHANAYGNMSADKVKLVAVCDRNRQQGETLAEMHNCQYFEDFDEMMEKVDLDVIDICLPTFLHEEYVIKAARRKKNIFCEKPITLDTGKLEHMLDEIRENGAKIFVGQVLRFWPEYRKAKELMDSGELGEIRYIFAARLSEHPKWSDWYRKPENSGGGLLDLHLHDIDYLCWVFGKVNAVYATGKQSDFGSWNYVSTILEFASGISATVQGVMEMEKGYPFTMELKIVGSEKTFEYGMKAGNNLEDIGASKRNTYLYDDGRVKELSIDRSDAYGIELEHFIECVSAGKESDIIDTESVRRVLYTIEAIKKSLETGQKVEVSC